MVSDRHMHVHTFTSIHAHVHPPEHAPTHTHTYTHLVEAQYKLLTNILNVCLGIEALGDPPRREKVH